MLLTRINTVLDSNELGVLTLAIDDYINNDSRHRADSKEVSAVWDKIREHCFAREVEIETPFAVI